MTTDREDATRHQPARPAPVPRIVRRDPHPRELAERLEEFLIRPRVIVVVPIWPLVVPTRAVRYLAGGSL